MGWEYVGADPSDPKDLIDVEYVTDVLLPQNLSQATIDATIAYGLSGFADKSYADTRDALNATQAYVDAGDATRLHQSRVGVASGVAPLNARGEIPLPLVGLSPIQRWPSPFFSPSSYFGSPVAASSAETTVYPYTVADPGYAYKLMIFGMVDGKTSVDGQMPIIYVRAGSTSGPVVAYGYGTPEHYGYTTIRALTASTTYTAGSTSLDVVVCGAGGGGGEGGVGGGAGHWAGAHLTPSLGQPLTVVVGTGGAGGTSPVMPPTPGTSGGASSVTGTGIGTVTGAGGAGGAQATTPSTAGASPGNFTFNGVGHQGGVGGARGTDPSDTSAKPGTAPGGGGGGGLWVDGGWFGQTTYYNGAPGGDGMVWITELIPPGSNDPDNAAPINLMPIPLESQPVLTGATTLYVRLLRNGASATVTATTFKPTLWVTPIPA